MKFINNDPLFMKKIAKKLAFLIKYKKSKLPNKTKAINKLTPKLSPKPKSSSAHLHHTTSPPI